MSESQVLWRQKPIAKEMEEYFASIEDLFEAALEFKPRQSIADRLMGPAVVSILFSLIPIIPAALWGIIQWRFAHLAFSIKGLTILIHSFSAWWGLCFTLAALALAVLIAVDSKRGTRAAPDLLSGAAFRFALCYAAGRELERFTKNKLSKHTELALQYWRKLRGVLGSMFSPVGAIDPRFGYVYENVEFPPQNEYGIEVVETAMIRTVHRPKFRSFFSEVLAFEGEYQWFKLSPTTLRIVNALDSLIVKVPGRIQDKKDIRSLAEVFFRLALYLYTTIPEVSKGDGPDGAENDGSEKALLSFVEVIEPMSVYLAERQPLVGKDKARSKAVLLGASICGLFVTENQLVKFFAWWAMVQMLTFGGVAVAFHYVPALKPELMISIVLPTPLLVAAAALAAPLRGKS
jgi:hypothetical protein